MERTYSEWQAQTKAIIIKDLGTDKNKHHYYLCRCPKCNKEFKALKPAKKSQVFF